MQETIPTLLPCPFCGAPARFTSECPNSVECSNDECVRKEWSDSIEESVARWNTRIPHDTLKARIAELEAALVDARGMLEATNLLVSKLSGGRSVMLQIGIERIDAALKESRP